MFLVWLIWFCAIDVSMLMPNYVPHQQHELSWNLSWTDLGLSLTSVTILLRTVVSWKHLIEETRLPACVFSVRGARPARVCVTPPGSEQAPTKWRLRPACTSHPQSRPDSGSARPLRGVVAQPSRPLPGVAAELGIILPWGTLSREQSAHPSSPLPAFNQCLLRWVRRKPLEIFHLNEFLRRKHSVYKVETIHGNKLQYFRGFF